MARALSAAHRFQRLEKHLVTIRHGRRREFMDHLPPRHVNLHGTFEILRRKRAFDMGVELTELVQKFVLVHHSDPWRVWIPVRSICCQASRISASAAMAALVPSNSLDRIV